LKQKDFAIERAARQACGHVQTGRLDELGGLALNPALFDPLGPHLQLKPARIS